MAGAQQAIFFLLFYRAAGTRITDELIVNETLNETPPAEDFVTTLTNMQCSSRTSASDFIDIKKYGRSVIAKSCRQQYDFPSTATHTGYQVIVNGCSNPVFPWKSNMCGVGLFTRPARRCSALASSQVKGRLDESLKPSSDRAFGVEFEFVARPGRREPAGLVEAVKELQACAEGTRSPRKPCTKTSECSVYDFCLRGTCQDRKLCSAGPTTCPPTMSWNFITDGSVRPLDQREANEAGASYDETAGTPFEIVSPPLSGRNGWQSTTEVLGLMRFVGVQAGPSSGIHVHINVIGDPPGVSSGRKLSIRGITNVWAAYAKYQHVINDMLSPGRQDNHYSKSLYLGDCDVSSEPPPGKDAKTWYGHYPHKFVRRIFRNMFEHRARLGKNTPTSHDAATEMCNEILRVPGDPNPCSSKRYPWQRYYQVNLIPLSKYGTLEFRGHSATYDQERVARWIQFLVAFVEYYGATKKPGSQDRVPGADEMNRYFSRSSWEEGFRELARDQQIATREELWQKLGNKVDGASEAFFKDRRWEKGDRICEKVSRDVLPRVQEFDNECCLEGDFSHAAEQAIPDHFGQTQRGALAADFLAWMDQHP